MHKYVAGWKGVRVNVNEMTDSPYGGRVCHTVAERTAEDVELQIDVQALAKYARRAVENQNGKCVLAGGAIRFVAKNVTQRPVALPLK